MSLFSLIKAFLFLAVQIGKLEEIKMHETRIIQWFGKLPYYQIWWQNKIPLVQFYIFINSQWSYPLSFLDENECETKDPCHQEAVCKNTIGSYNCTCKNGYEGDGVGEVGCQDINECLMTRNGGCHIPHAICLNTDGSFTCKCKPGFSGEAPEKLTS